MQRLQQLIDTFERFHPESSVRFDFGALSPGDLGSYRGYYDQLAIGFGESYPYPSASAVLQNLKQALGATFEGYKGGEYTMTGSTRVWVANYGESTDTGIVNVEERLYGDGPGYIIIHTAYEE